MEMIANDAKRREEYELWTKQEFSDFLTEVEAGHKISAIVCPDKEMYEDNQGIILCWTR